MAPVLVSQDHNIKKQLNQMATNLDQIDSNKNKFFNMLDSLVPVLRSEAFPLKSYLRKKQSNSDIAVEPSIKNDHLP